MSLGALRRRVPPVYLLIGWGLSNPAARNPSCVCVCVCVVSWLLLTFPGSERSDYCCTRPYGTAEYSGGTECDGVCPV